MEAWATILTVVFSPISRQYAQPEITLENTEYETKQTHGPNQVWQNDLCDETGKVEFMNNKEGASG